VEGRVPSDNRGFDIPYRDFWRIYLQAHSNPGTRGMHYAATIIGTSGTVAALMLEEWLIMPAGILAGVGMALASHRWIEGNRPLIRLNPIYGAICDVRMLWLASTGRLGAEYRRLGLSGGPGAPPAA
jgi:hypothetical protein